MYTHIVSFPCTGKMTASDVPPAMTESLQCKGMAGAIALRMMVEAHPPLRARSLSHTQPWARARVRVRVRDIRKRTTYS